MLVRDAAERERIGALAEVEHDYGSLVLLRAPLTSVQAALASAGDATPVSTRLQLHGLSFDPLAQDPLTALADPRGRYADWDSCEDYLVQYSAPVRDEWLDALRAAGLDVLQYLPDQAWWVRGSAQAARRAQRLPAVRFVGPWHPAYRLAPSLQWVYQEPTRATAATRVFELAVARGVGTVALEPLLRAAGGRLQQRLRVPHLPYDLWRVELPESALADLARLPGILSLDPYVAPTAEDERAAQIVAGNYLDASTLDAPGYDPLLQFGVNGAGVTVAVSDDGIGIPGDGGYYISNANAAHGPLRGASSSASGHGHLQATIIAGSTPAAGFDPLGYQYALGVAPAAHLLNIPLLRPGYSGSDVQAADDTVSGSGPNGVRASISNNSWGAGANDNHYDALAAVYDALTQDASLAPSIDPLLFVFSAGNLGSTGLTRPKVAKNVLAIAASENYRPEAPTASGSTVPADNIDELPDFSGRGPAFDGRIKPDLTAPGEAVTGGRSGPDALFGNLDSYHRISSGTSHAAPQVAGAAALITQAWKSSHAGANPSPALVKALLINGAVDMSGAGATEPMPNGAEGWGRIHLKHVLSTAAPLVARDQQVVLTEPGEVYRWDGTVASATAELRVAVVWTDAPGISDPALVNDLDLEAQIGGFLYRGNVLAGGISMPDGSADRRNNVERIQIPAGLGAGTPIRLSVRASALNGNGVLGNADLTDQHFALVCLNCIEDPGFRLVLTADTAALCTGVPYQRPLAIESLGGYAGAVTLSATGWPAPGQVSISPNPLTPAVAGSLQLLSAGMAPAEYPITLNGVSGSLQRSAAFRAHLANAPPSASPLLVPADNAVNVATGVVLQWGQATQAFDYRVEFASDPAFAQILASTRTRALSWAPGLAPGSSYWWRVIAGNACSDAAYSFANGFEDGAVGAGTVSATGSFSTAPAATAAAPR